MVNIGWGSFLGSPVIAAVGFDTGGFLRRTYHDTSAGQLGVSSNKHFAGETNVGLPKLLDAWNPTCNLLNHIL